MKAKAIIAVLAFVFGNILVVSSANAQYVVKGNSCAKSTFSEPLEIFKNHTGVTKNVTFQIVRDGCRPKGTDGSFIYRSVPFVGGSSSNDLMTRLGKRTSAALKTVSSNWKLQVYFIPGVAPKAGGTFDYILAVD